MAFRDASAPSFLTRVVLHNYKSIATCDVALGPLIYLVGPNGSGKSNFVDALHLVRDGLSGSLDNALNERGGLSEVRRRSSGHPTHFGMRLEFRLRDNRSGHYAFNIGALSRGGYEVQTEVFANREYEAWFLAAAESLQGQRGFGFEKTPAFEPERLRNAKGWLGERMIGGKYRETTDQPAFSSVMDLQQALNLSRSFRKLCSEWSRQVG